MKLVQIFLSLLLLFVLELNPQDSGCSAEKTCKQVLSDLTKRQFKGISKCTKKMKFKNGKEKAKKMNCVLKCVMIDEGVLNDKGMFSADQIDVLIQREFPPSLHSKANDTFQPCIEKADKMNPSTDDDPFCKTYDPFIKCLLGGLPTLCG